MENGGNQKLKDYLAKFGLLEEDIKTKYNSVAANWYRKNLAAVAFGQPDSFNQPEPTEEEGKRPMEDGAHSAPSAPKQTKDES